MKKNYPKIFMAIAIMLAGSASAQVGISTATPNGALDITSTNDGLLVPRIALTNTTTATVVTPTTSELVYNTATINDVTPGFYYWDGAKWVRLQAGKTAWELTGNSGTVAGTNFIGTTDAVDLRFKTAGADRWNISNANNGQLQSYSLGTAALPTYSFQGDPNTGAFSSGADAFDFTTGGTARFRIPNANQVHALALGTAALPFYSFQADPNTGIFSPTADMLAYTTGGAERMRINTTGQVFINSLTTIAGDRFSVFNTAATDYAVNGYSSGTGVGVYGGNTGTGYGVYGANGSTGIGVLGENISNGAGVYGITAGATSAGVFGVANAANGSATYGQTTGAAANGVEGFASGASGTGVYGSASGNLAVGTFGITNVANGSGVWGYNLHASGTGLLGSGNNQSANYLTAGSGGAFTGTITGSVSYSKNAVSTGVVGAGNNLAATTITQGSGGAFNGNQWGVFANAALSGSGATDRAAFVGNYNDNATASTVYVGARIGGVHYKVLGPGAASVSTTMPTRDGERVLFAPESPENWFFDIGEATLVDGKATVTIDPLFVDCMSDSKPFKVFVQGGEDTYGSIRVTRDQNGKTFILEDMGGASSGTVQYSIYAIWKQKENLRFPKYQPSFQTIENESATTRQKEMPKARKAEVTTSKKPQSQPQTLTSAQ
ncbi:hypothetical protein [Flavobacterium sp.]|uniref:hypothetical protein n=1 Tax=Flavobacterium sp. TaxID=239 RepID=UPI0039E54490